MRQYLYFSFFFFLSCTWNKITPDIIVSPLVCEPSEQIFLNEIQPIIESNCLDCHSENRPALLGTYEGVIDGLENYELLDWVESKQMPPAGLPPLTDIEINIIKDWADCE